jgi:hypothetical protein
MTFIGRSRSSWKGKQVTSEGVMVLSSYCLDNGFSIGFGRYDLCAAAHTIRVVGVLHTIQAF